LVSAQIVCFRFWSCSKIFSSLVTKGGACGWSSSMLATWYGWPPENGIEAQLKRRGGSGPQVPIACTYRREARIRIDPWEQMFGNSVCCVCCVVS
jgi:hypothetical protein